MAAALFGFGLAAKSTWRRSGSRDLTAEVAPVTGVESVPLWIGSPDRPLFAWLDLPDDRLVAGAAVICPSMGLEAAYSTRALRAPGPPAGGLRLGGTAARLRGDGGLGGDLVRPRPRGGVAREHPARASTTSAPSARPGSAVVGLRLGATLAAAELGPRRTRGRPGAVGPVCDGQGVPPRADAPSPPSGASWPSSGGRAGGRGRETEARRARGWSRHPAPCSPLRQSCRPGARWRSRGATRALATRELVLTRRGRRVERRLAKRLTLPHVESAEIDGQEALFEDKPVDAGADAGSDRLLARGGRRSGGAVHDARTHGRPQSTGRRVGPTCASDRSSSGRPTSSACSASREGGIDPSAPTVIFLNVGLIGHHGPGRLWVELARACAAGGGVRCLRVDLSGIGDSPARPGRTELRSFPAGRPRGPGRHPSCGRRGRGRADPHGRLLRRRHAIETALPEPVASLCVINPALSYVRWGDDASANPVEEDASGVCRPPDVGLDPAPVVACDGAVRAVSGA